MTAQTMSEAQREVDALDPSGRFWRGDVTLRELRMELRDLDLQPGSDREQPCEGLAEEIAVDDGGVGQNAEEVLCSRSCGGSSWICVAYDGVDRHREVVAVVVVHNKLLALHGLSSRHGGRVFLATRDQLQRKAGPRWSGVQRKHPTTEVHPGTASSARVGGGRR